MGNIFSKYLSWQKKGMKTRFVYTVSSRENITGFGTYSRYFYTQKQFSLSANHAFNL